MANPVIQPALVVGELSPSLFGRVDTARFRIAAGTMRNAFVGFRGGAYSRAGTSFVGFSKQTGRAVPPRLIPFQFSVDQGRILEFGNFYMRVIANGAFVTEAPIPINAISKANPAVLIANAEGASAAAPNSGAVTSSYAAGDTVILAGGTPSVPTEL